MVNPDSAGARVLVVDDHPMVREGLRSMLAGSGFEVVGEAGSAEEAVRLATERTPDVILLDIGLPGADGLAALASLKQAAPRAAVLIVTMHDDPGLVRRAVAAGAAGYVLKGISRRELLAAVRGVHDGEAVVEPGLLRSLLASQPKGPAAPPLDPLTPVEREVLQLITAGLTNREISQRMRWSLGTAKKYVQRILEKLGVSDRTQAAVAAVTRGLVD